MNINGLNNKNKTLYHTVPEMITKVLRKAILSGQLKEGAQLKQEELAVQFSVSMSPVREALKNLEAEGLVKIYPNRGAAVSELSADEAQEIFDIRLFLELGALELAIPNLSGADLGEAKKLLDQADNETCSDHWSGMNWQFHQTLYLPAGRPKLLKLIQTLHNNLERYMRLYLSTMNYYARSQEEHRELLEACTEKNVKLAQNILRKHMAGASAVLVNYLKHRSEK